MIIKRILIINLLLAVALALAALNANAGDAHKVVMHISDNDEARMALVMNNAANVNKYYQDKGEEVTIEIVAYGPGLHMLRDDTSPVKDRVKSFAQNYDNISFQACANTQANMSKKEGKDVKLVSQAKVVPSGAVHLVARQEEGWSYLRP